MTARVDARSSVLDRIGKHCQRLQILLGLIEPTSFLLGARRPIAGTHHSAHSH